MALTKVTYAMIDSAPVNIMDWIPTQYHEAIKDFTSTVPVESYIQAAMDSGAGSIYFPMGYYVIASPLYVTNEVVGSNQAANLTFVGENRTSTYFAGPGASSFTPSGTGIRAMIINQSNNGKFSLKNLRFQGDIGAGYVLYALENGTTSQALFSGVIEDCWFSLFSTNAGIFYGALQNFVVANNTFESAKGCFYLAGNGVGDIHFTNNSMYSCFDGFINATEGFGSYNINVSNLNCYEYYRGPLFSGKNVINCNISNVNLVGAEYQGSALGTIGICDFEASENVNITNFNCTGVLDDVVMINGCTINVSDGFIGACNSGLKVYGSNTSNDITIQNVNITEASVSAFWHAADPSGGDVYVENCNWSNNIGESWVDQGGSPSYNVTLNNSVFLNAGYPNGSAGTRNLIFGTSGNVNVNNCIIGRTSTDAKAYYYVEAAGTGECNFTDCTFTTLAAPAGFGNEIFGTQVVKTAGGLKNRHAQYYASAAPTTGTWYLGDRVFNSAPATGQPKGWICTVAGTPGTWVSEGNL